MMEGASNEAQMRPRVSFTADTAQRLNSSLQTKTNSNHKRKPSKATTKERNKQKKRQNRDARKDKYKGANWLHVQQVEGYTIYGY